MSISNQLKVQAFGAFTGAFFVYLFTRIADFFQKVYQRQTKHYNSLVNLETQLNEIGGIIDDDIYIIREFIRVIKSGHVYFNNIRNIPIDKSHYENLYDLNLINILFSFNYQIRKLNDDIETINKGYEKIESAFTLKNITALDYQFNCDGVASKLTLMNLFLSKLLKENIKLLARVRLQIKKDIPFGTKLQFVFTKSKALIITKQELKEEENRLKLEISKTKRKSRNEIDDVLKKAGLFESKLKI